MNLPVPLVPVPAGYFPLDCPAILRLRRATHSCRDVCDVRVPLGSWKRIAFGIEDKSRTDNSVVPLWHTLRPQIAIFACMHYLFVLVSAGWDTSTLMAERSLLALLPDDGRVGLYISRRIPRPAFAPLRDRFKPSCVVSTRADPSAKISSRHAQQRPGTWSDVERENIKLHCRDSLPRDPYRQVKRMS